MPIHYFANRAATLAARGSIPPSHLRKSLHCDYCKEEVWVTKESWEEANRKEIQILICERCWEDGRHRTG